MITEVLDRGAGRKMEQAADHVGSEFSTVRTGRANPQILHRISIDYYGTTTPCNSWPPSRSPNRGLLVVQPFDKSSMAGDREGHPGFGPRSQSRATTAT